MLSKVDKHLYQREWSRYDSTIRYCTYTHPIPPVFRISNDDSRPHIGKDNNTTNSPDITCCTRLRGQKKEEEYKFSPP